ncbi:unnamed protein product, partial [Lymnaea stagnalis]
MEPDILTSSAKVLFVFINCRVLATIVVLFGIAANVANSIVFYRQGLGSSMNISFFSLSLSNLFSVVALLWMNFCNTIIVEYLELYNISNDIVYLTGGWPSGCALRITSWITAYMTAERCLCVAFPLKVKTIATPLIIKTITLGNVLALIPEYASVYYDWSFIPGKNRTVLGLAFRSNRAETKGLVFTFHAALAVTSLVALATFTFILIFQLKQRSNWRLSSLANSKQNEAISARDKRAVTLVIAVAILLIVCYSPIVSTSLGSSFAPEFSVAGRQANLFNACWSFAFLLGAISSSVNIILYYLMSSKYRLTFQRML